MNEYSETCGRCGSVVVAAEHWQDGHRIWLCPEHGNVTGETVFTLGVKKL